MTSKVVLAAIFCLMANIVLAQVPAPQLRCVTKRFNGDIDITWQLPPVPITCGTLVGFNLYASLYAHTFLVHFNDRQ